MATTMIIETVEPLYCALGTTGGAYHYHIDVHVHVPLVI